MDIEYYVFDKMNVQSEKVEVAIEIMRSLSMYKDLFKDSNNYFLYSLIHSQKEFKENKDVWSLMETHGMDILPKERRKAPCFSYGDIRRALSCIM
ncbi:hypothetical protein [uncultured Trichococcus sp.]|uniref:hypothetical protein n=1 Tax=uncultured Trichococcus sp. TaxID=189665 RepID=UPI0029C60187|nr:hypothetical protein [uncultured Trichococcus sp.]